MLPGSPFAASTALYLNILRHAVLNKAIPIQYIDGKCHNKETEKAVAKLPYPVVTSNPHATGFKIIQKSNDFMVKVR